MRRVRMIDVANAAKVSMTTASYVLNDRDVQIPEVTRQRIWNAAKELGYQPNRLAQNLAHQKSGLIGVLTPINPSPFHAQLTGELSARASALSYTLIFESIGNEGFQSAIDRLLQWRVDGLLLWCQGFVPRIDPEYPTILIGHQRDFPDDCSFVRVDLYEGARQAAEHLVSLGHRQICYVGHAESEDDPRWQALRDVAVSSLLPEPTRLVEAGDRGRWAPDVIGKAAVEATAFFCISDVQALTVFRSLRDAGLRVPEDHSIVSCDESWAAENVDPALTAVAVPVGEMADRALVALVEGISDGWAVPIRSVLTPNLVIRESSARPSR